MGVKAILGRRAWRRAGAVLAALAGLWAFLAWTPLPDRAVRGDWSSALLSSQGSLLRLTLNRAGRYRVKLDLDQISPDVVRGFLRYEDRWFRWHPGIDPLAVARAAGQNLAAGRVVSGASTITMQLARMLRRRPRTFRSKLIEAFEALQLEARCSKREILELYLNNVPMGGNVEGVGAASLLYFGKLPSRLSLSEAALLVSLPRSPNARRPDRSRRKAREGRDEVLERILDDPARVAAEQAWPVPEGRRANPRRAPQWIQRLQPALDADPGLRESTLDDGLQSVAESILAEAHRRLAPLGVHNGALLIVDNPSRRVLAYVGSADTGDPRGGQVNCADIVRSPGSALKPFLYGLALDAGLLSPRGALFDIPRDYGGYRPINFEGAYSGVVPAEEALTRSLNTPAVWLESRLQAGDGGGLEQLLRRTGFGSRGRNAVDPGLSVALGAHPVTLEELVSLYAGLADGGVWRPLRFFDDRPADGASRRLLSAQAAFIVAEMLSNGRRPDLPNAWEDSPDRGRVAFKTGTSFGLRDAWCVAYDPRYTVGVWLGNADAQGAAGLKASEKAAPLALAVFNRLNRAQDRWFSPPPGVARREVCADSGLPPNADCPTHAEEWFIPGVSPYVPCTVHRAIMVRRRDGRRVALDCMPGPPKDYRREVVAVWPPDVTRYLRGSGSGFHPLPRPAADCPSLAELPGPHIISPEPGATYEAAGLGAAQRGLALSAQASPDVQRLYWEVDGYAVADGPPDEVEHWTPSPGDHEVAVLDSQGRAQSVRFKVR